MSTFNDQIEDLRRFPRAKIRVKELAELLLVSEAALNSHRQRGTGIPAVTLMGCRPYYDRDEVIAWLLAQQVRNSRGATPAFSPVL